MNPISETRDFKDWQGRYDSKRTGWDRGSVTPALQQWLDSGLLQPCRILIPGCGRGYEVIALAAAGFQVTALDIASTPIEFLKNELLLRGLDATVEQADLFEWRSSKPFEAIFEQTCLCAIDPGRRIQYQGWLKAHLSPRGKLFALFMQTFKEGGPPFHCDMADMKTLFQAPDWQWMEEHELIVNDRGEIFEQGRILIG